MAFRKMKIDLLDVLAVLLTVSVTVIDPFSRYFVIVILLLMALGVKAIASDAKVNRDHWI